MDCINCLWCLEETKNNFICKMKNKKIKDPSKICRKYFENEINLNSFNDKILIPKVKIES